MNKKKISLLLIGVLLLSTIVGIVPLVNATIPPTEPGNEEYMSVMGLLDSDTYILYPYEEESINIGFSKYGEMIDGDMGLGLKYKGVDVFANSMVPKDLWCNGWVMDIHYTEGGYLRNVWAYALFSDRTVAGIEGDWQNGQESEDASAVGDTNGGRRTNGYAETDPIRVIYDGPRKAIYLLKTTIYDKDPADMGTQLVTLTIQLVFDKVSKNVMEIKDVKRVDDNKMNGPFQIEFSQRAEWDIGLSSASESYAEFYQGIPTKYDKHPFYIADHTPGMEVTFDLCQIIGEEDLVGYAAYWPPLISKWVTNAEEVRRFGVDVDVPSLLSTMETYEHYLELPTSADQLVDPAIFYDVMTGEMVFLLPKEPVAYPRGMGVWSEAPWVFKKDGTGDYAKMFQETITSPGSWRWNATEGPYGAVRIKPFQWNWGNEFVIVFKRVMQGHTPHMVTAQDCMPWDGFQVGDPAFSLGMYSEPDTPYVFAEWDFDLDMDHPENSTHQFRCVSVYGVTDNHNAVDPDQATAQGTFLIDKEVIYQLEEIFNPWDLKDAAHLDKFRWAQKGPMADTIVLSSHMCLETEHEVYIPEKWGYYCEDSEKVLAYTSSGQVLLIREVDYTISGHTISISNDHGADTYKVLYSTVKDEYVPWHNGQYEWTVLGENSHASDSLGAAMLATGWEDWKNIEVWLSGLDVDSAMGPSIPVTMRKFAETEDPNRLNYHYDQAGGDLRAAFRDDWCTPDDWDGSWEIHPYAISSSDLLVVGGPIANEAAMYFNDFTDAFVFSGYGAGFYAPGCWARTTQDHYQGMDFVDVVDDELWYNSVTTDDDIGHAIVSTYKDLNETVGFVVYGYTAEDTYYACYALRSGLIPWMQHLQNGVTTLIIEIDYSDLHPVQFHVKESLGRFTECTGFDTDFKCMGYYINIDMAQGAVECEAEDLGLCYKLIDIEWCAQLHPDP